MRALATLAAAVLLLSVSCARASGELNGFDLSRLAIPRAELLPGGPPRDGIPALTDPTFVPAASAGFMRANDRVIGMHLHGIAKAYPIRILNWHEIVNDRFAGEPVTVTYCPLCYTGIAFKAEYAGRRMEFGVSGLLYNSDVVLYDRETGSLWSQLMSQAISGPRVGSRLEPIPVTHTTWREWHSRHPGSLVLSPRTGYRRDYGRDSYADYARSRDVVFPVRFRASGFHPKQPVLGIVIDGVAQAYPLSELAKSGFSIEDVIGGQRVTVRFDGRNQSAEIFDDQDQRLPGVLAYWFAWYAFHPDTGVYRAARR